MQPKNVQVFRGHAEFFAAMERVATSKFSCRAYHHFNRGTTNALN